MMMLYSVSLGLSSQFVEHIAPPLPYTNVQVIQAKTSRAHPSPSGGYVVPSYAAAIFSKVSVRLESV